MNIGRSTLNVKTVRFCCRAAGRIWSPHTACTGMAETTWSPIPAAGRERGRRTGHPAAPSPRRTRPDRVWSDGLPGRGRPPPAPPAVVVSRQVRHGRPRQVQTGRTELSFDPTPSTRRARRQSWDILERLSDTTIKHICSLGSIHFIRGPVDDDGAWLQAEREENDDVLC